MKRVPAPAAVKRHGRHPALHFPGLARAAMPQRWLPASGLASIFKRAVYVGIGMPGALPSRVSEKILASGDRSHEADVDADYILVDNPRSAGCHGGQLSRPGRRGGKTTARGLASGQHPGEGAQGYLAFWCILPRQS
ncbi:MAG: hypothetical protein MZV70_74500 [Desulfobacterales bacterium]|nr:hypothetical protein [Desulfobacterales bacterium]